MIEKIFEFWSLHEPQVRWVVFGSALLAAVSALVGSFSFLRKRSLAGDALAHAALPGVTTIFLLSHSRSALVLLSGAMISCSIALIVIEFLSKYTKVKEDSSLAIVLSLFFALGIFQLTIIQRLDYGNQAGLDKLLFGQAAAIVTDDLVVLAVVAIVVIFTVSMLYQRLKIVAFDALYARSIGIKASYYQYLLSFLLVVAVVLGLQLVGVVLMAAILLTPAAAARYWTDNLAKMLILAASFGVVSGVLGAQVSYLAPRMPTGPWMVMIVSLIFAVSVAFAPNRGIITNYLKRRKLKHRMQEENVLRVLYKLVESRNKVSFDISEILSIRSFKIEDLKSILRRLKNKHSITIAAEQISLTNAGQILADKITRRHRLWELYLSKKLKIADDHVHADAEEIEHILTGELESNLLAELEQPMHDPHGRSIPANREGEH